MKNTQLNQVIRLVRRTGDRVVIMDNESEEVMVLLNMNSYEKLLSGTQMVEKLTEEELLEKINRDIAVWRAYNESEESAFEEEENQIPKILPKQKINTDKIEIEPEDDKTEEDIEEMAKNIEKTAENIGIVENEEPLGGIAEDGEEEKFYLEPIE